MKQASQVNVGELAHQQTEELSSGEAEGVRGGSLTSPHPDGLGKKLAGTETKSLKAGASEVLM